jgi:hypothetical protein
MEKKEFLTAGINPYYQSQEEIADFLSDNLKFTEEEYATVSEIHFYGAGVTPEKAGVLCDCLKKGEAETPKAAEGQTEGGVTEPNPTRDN